MNPKLIIDLERIGYFAKVWETPDGYLVTWGDYVANEWHEGHATLGGVLERLTALAEEDQGGWQ